MTWCFDCEENKKGDELALCKDKKHDTDDDHLFQPATLQSQSDKKEAEKNHAETLLEFLKDYIKDIVISQNDSSSVFALISVDGHAETIEIGTTHSIQWLKAKYYNSEKKIFPEESYKSALEIIKSKALFNKKIKNRIIFKRVALHNDEIFYDLCDPDWKLVKITKESVKIVNHGEDTPPFQRSKNQSQQVEPNLIPDGNPIEKFCKLLRIQNILLFKVHLISFFVENIPTPIMLITGSQGSIKSTQSGLIKRVVDPSGQKIEDNLNHFPKKVDDLNILLANNYMVSCDNVSYISDESSDCLCKGVTGASYSKRKLYTDSDETILKYQRKVILNGISPNVDNGDLAERIITYNTKKISEEERLPVEEIERNFKELRVDLLGQIFLTLQKALREYDSVKSEIKKLPRMADFAIWGESISQALGCKKGEFLRVYDQFLDENNDILNENSPIIPFLENQLCEKDEFVTPAGMFYDSLECFAVSDHYDTKSRNFPKSSNKLRGYLTRQRPLLDEHGFTIEIYKNTEKNKFTKNTTLVKVRKVSSPPSPSSPLIMTAHKAGERSEHGEDKIKPLEVS